MDTGDTAPVLACYDAQFCLNNPWPEAGYGDYPETLALLVICSPALWRWHMRGKVLPYYKQLRKIEIDLPTKTVEQIDAALEQLARLDAELARRVRVSVSYLPEVYQLRVHVRYIVDELIRRKEQLVAGQAAHAAQDGQPTREAAA